MRPKQLAIVLCSLVLFFNLAAQQYPPCGEDLEIINFGPDTVCEGRTVVIGSSLLAQEYYWSSGYASHNSFSKLKPEVKVGPGTHTLRIVRRSKGGNLVPNGDFEQGRNGHQFTHDHDPNLQSGGDAGSGEGKYWWATYRDGDVDYFHGNFQKPRASSGDHFIAYNGRTAANVSVIKTTAKGVVAGETYWFSIMSMWLNGANFPKFKVLINGKVIGEYQVRNGNWAEFKIQWTADTSGDVEIEIVNAEGAQVGNDFAIDDISLFKDDPCEEEAEITIYSKPRPKLDDLFMCTGEGAVQLDAKVDNGEWDVEYSNTNSNGALDANGLFDPEVAGPGIHQVRYTNDCGTDWGRIEIEEGASAGNDTIIGECAPATTVVTISDYLTGAGDGGHWVNLDSLASFDTTSTVFDPTGLPAGEYHFGYTIPGEGRCVDTAIITFVVSEVQLEDRSVGANCGQPNGYAIVYAYGGVPEYTYSWDGHSSTTDTLELVEEGSYDVTVTDAKGCNASTSVTVEIIEPPKVTIDSIVHPSCPGELDGEVYATIVGAEGIDSISWTGGYSTEDITGLGEGTYEIIVVDLKGCADTVDTILVDPTEVIVLRPDVKVCVGQCIDIGADVSGGTAPYTLYWDNVQQDSLLNQCPVANTNHQVYAIDSRGCPSETVDYVIGIADPLVFVELTDTLICEGDQVEICAQAGGGDGNYTYSWINSNETGACITDTPTGDTEYTVEVTDGCDSPKATGTAKVTLNIVDFETTSQPEHCDHNDGIAEVTNVTSGIAPYTYNWENGASTGAQYENIAKGTYNVEVTDSLGCKANKDVVVDEVLAPTVDLVASQDPLCNGGSDGWIEVAAQGGTPPYTYQWDDPATQTTARVENLAKGTYRVVIYDAEQCMVGENYTLNEPSPIVLDVTPDQVICIDACTDISVSPTGGTPPYSQIWQHDNSTTATVNVCPTQDETYTVVVTDANGCGPETISTNVSLKPDLQLSITPNQVICLNESVQLTVTANGVPDYSYLWQETREATPSITVTPTEGVHIYTVDVTDECGDASIQTEVLVHPLPTIDISPYSEGCIPHDVTLTNNTQGLVSVLWNFGNGYYQSDVNSVSHTYEEAGLYDIEVEIEDGNGCKNTILFANHIQANPNPTADFEADKYQTDIVNSEVRFDDATISENEIIQWTWTFPDDEIYTEQDTKYSFKDSGDYVVQLDVEDVNGCTSTIQKPIRVDGIFTIYVPNAFTPDGDGNNDFFPPQEIGLDYDEYELWIFDRWGEMIYHTENYNDPWNGRKFNNLENSQIDTYVYKIKGKSIYDEKVSLVGKVTIIR